MKVLHLISGGDTGGAKTHLISLMKGLNKKVDAKVICFIEDTFYYDLKEENIDIEVFEQKSRFDMSVVSRLKLEIKTKNYDIVHCHGARANFIGMFLKRSISVPMLTTIHSDYRLDFKDSLIKKLIFTPLNIIALKSFNYYIAISDQFKQMLVDRGFSRDKIYVAYNGIDLDSPVKFKSKKEFLQSFNIDFENESFIGIVARLDQVKDHDTFLNMAKELVDKNKNVKFLIAGNGIREDELKEKVKELKLDKYVYFLGFIDNPYDVFNAIDINVLTSKSESFPYSILEGGKMKKPIVSTNVGGLSNLIKNGKNGFLVDVGDYKTMANKIELMLNDKDKLLNMGKNLYKSVEEKYSSDYMADIHIEIYNKILKMED